MDPKFTIRIEDPGQLSTSPGGGASSVSSTPGLQPTAPPVTPSSIPDVTPPSAGANYNRLTDFTNLSKMAGELGWADKLNRINRITDLLTPKRFAAPGPQTSGPPAPDSESGIINPKPSGVPGIVSGAKEIAGPQAASEAAGTAEAAAGGGVAEMAAGPIGGMVMAAKLVADEAAKSVKGLRESVEGASRTVQDLASNNNDSALRRLGDGFTGLIEKVPLAGKVWAEEIRLVQSFGRAVTDVTSAFVARGREISGYSGPLATATAMVDVRDLLMDIKEAQYTGKNLAELTTAQEDISIALREILLPIKNQLIHVITPIMQLTARGLELLVQPVEKAADNVSKTYDATIAGHRKMLEHLPLIGDTLKKMFEKMDKAAGEGDAAKAAKYWKDFLDNLKRGEAFIKSQPNQNDGDWDLDLNRDLSIPVVLGGGFGGIVPGGF